MSTIIEENKAALADFRRQDAAIAAMKQEYMGLSIKGVDDKAGYDAVHQARMTVKKHRCAVEEKRKDLKSEALEFGRKVDAEAKRLTSMLAPIEDHLKKEEDAFLAEKERLKRQAEEAKYAMLRARIQAFQAAGAAVNPLALQSMTEDEFQTALENAKREAAERAAAQEEADRKRKEQEAAAESERQSLAAERERLAEERRQQEAQARAIEEERSRLAEERRKVEGERARIGAQRLAVKELAEQATIDQAVEDQRPYLDRILSIAGQLDGICVPPGPLSVGVAIVLEEAAERIRTLVGAVRQ
jgi:DNA repair exonuclease SbcCD ATPase subunit